MNSSLTKAKSELEESTNKTATISQGHMLDETGMRLTAFLQKVLALRFSTVLIFAALFIPMLITFFHIDTKAPDTMENREFAKFPREAVSNGDFRAFATGFDAYFKDHFGLRAWFLHFHKSLALNVFQKSASPIATIGKDGFVFLWIKEYMQEAHTWPKEKMQKDLEMFRKQTAQAQDLGTTYLAVGVPYKANLYRKHLPNHLQFFMPEARLSLLSKHLLLSQEAPFLNLTAILEASEKQTYFKADHHWNHYGAWVGYKAIMAELAKKVPHLRILPEDAVSFETGEGGIGWVGHSAGWTQTELVPLMKFNANYCDDPETLRSLDKTVPNAQLAQYYGGGGYDKHGWSLQSYYRCGDKSLNAKKLLLMNDSFSASILPYLVRTFAEVHTSRDDSEFRTKMETLRPDVAVNLAWEYYL